MILPMLLAWPINCFLRAVALCYIDLDKQDQLGLVIVHDGYSGKQIGKYDLATGLNLD